MPGISKGWKIWGILSVALAWVIFEHQDAKDDLEWWMNYYGTAHSTAFCYAYSGLDVLPDLEDKLDDFDGDPDVGSKGLPFLSRAILHIEAMGIEATEEEILILFNNLERCGNRGELPSQNDLMREHTDRFR